MKKPKFSRKLPRQVNSRSLDGPGENGLGRNVSGGTRPRLSWGRSLWCATRCRLTPGVAPTTGWVGLYGTGPADVANAAIVLGPVALVILWPVGGLIGAWVGSELAAARAHNPKTGTGER